MQPHAVHNLIHNEGCTSHVAAVLHPGDESVEDHNVGQEDDDTTYTADYAVDDEVLEWSVSHPAAHSLAEPLHCGIYPIHGVLADVECAEKH